MSLNSAELTALMTSKVLAAAADGPLADITPVLKAISEAVVEHFKANADVLPAGVPPMSTPSGPVVGKGKIA